MTELTVSIGRSAGTDPEQTVELLRSRRLTDQNESTVAARSAKAANDRNDPSLNDLVRALQRACNWITPPFPAGARYRSSRARTPTIRTPVPSPRSSRKFQSHAWREGSSIGLSRDRLKVRPRASE